MRMLGIIWILVMFAIGASAGEVTEDKKAIQGTWSVVAAVFEGKKVAAAEFNDLKFVITADQMNFRKGDKNVGEEISGYRLDSSKNPKTIDALRKFIALRKDGLAAELLTGKLAGIYKLEGNDLIMALVKETQPKQDPKDKIEEAKPIVRPKTFQGGSDVFVLTLKRVEK